MERSLASGTNVLDWHHEFCADYIAGIVSELRGVDHEVMHNVFADNGFVPTSGDHPNGGLRGEAYDLGVEWAQNNTHLTFQNFLLQDNGQLQSMFRTDILSQFPGGYDEYVGL